MKARRLLCQPPKTFIFPPCEAQNYAKLHSLPTVRKHFFLDVSSKAQKGIKCECLVIFAALKTFFKHCFVATILSKRIMFTSKIPRLLGTTSAKILFFQLKKVVTMRHSYTAKYTEKTRHPLRTTHGCPRLNALQVSDSYNGSAFFRI